MELQQKIMEAQEKELEIREENLALKEKIKELEAQIALAQQLSFDGSVYWRVQLAGAPKEGPFCQCCYDSERQLIRLQTKVGISDFDDNDSLTTTTIMNVLNAKTTMN